MTTLQKRYKIVSHRLSFRANAAYHRDDLPMRVYEQYLTIDETTKDRLGNMAILALSKSLRKQ